MEYTEKATQEKNMLKMEHNTQNVQEIPLEQLIGRRKKVKNEYIYYNLLYQLVKTNTAKLNYNKYGTQGFKLKQVSSIFSDNILLACLVPAPLIKTSDEEGPKIKVVEDYVIAHYRHIIMDFFKINKLDVTASKIQLAHVRKTDGEKGRILVNDPHVINQVYKKFKLEPEEDACIEAQYFKCELANLDYEDVIKVFNFKNIEQDLLKNFVYIGDIDFTCDFCGSFNKQKIINHLREVHNFRLENAENERECANYTIVDNNHHVGRNCLTFITNGIRYKIYNKFVHSIECKSNKSRFGTNLYNWINNKEERLYETIPKTIEGGMTRCEITFYVKNNKIPTQDYIVENIEYLYNLIPEELTYKTPICEQWKAFVENKQDNVVLCDIDNKNIAICYSINKDTGKISGVLLDNVKEYDFYYVIKNCMFNMEIQLYILSFTDKTETTFIPKTEYVEGKRLKVNVEKQDLVKYYKISKYVVSAIKDNIYTYVVTPHNLYYTVGRVKGVVKNKKVYSPQEQGLVKQDKINLIYNNKDEHDKRNNKKFDIDKLDCVFKTNCNVSFKMQTKQNYLDQESREDFETKHKTQINESMEDNIDTFNKFVEKEQSIKRYNDMLKLLGEKYKTYKHKALKHVEPDAEITVYAIKPTKTKFNDTYLLLCEDPVNAENNFLTYPNTTLLNYINKIINSLNVNNQLIYFLDDTTSYILKVIINEQYIYEGKDCTTFKSIKPNGYLTAKFNNIVKEQEQTKEEIKNNSLEWLDPATREKSCIKVDDLEEGKKYYITHLIKKKGEKEKYVFKIEGDENTYISTSFLEELLKENTPSTKFYLTIGTLKLDKSKKKHRIVYI